MVVADRQLRKNEHLNALSGGEDLANVKTAADSVKLAGWLVSASKSFDQMMLIARIIISEGCRERDNRLTSLLSFSWARERGHYHAGEHR